MTIMTNVGLNGIVTISLRITILLLVIQIVFCSQNSILLPRKDCTFAGNKGGIITQGKPHLWIENQHCNHPFYRNRCIRIRGGGKSDPKFRSAPGIVAEVESFFRNKVIPRLHDERERFQLKFENHLERQENKKQDQLKRNKIWRETAEAPLQSGKVSLSPSVYASTPLVACSSLSKASSLPLHVLKFGVVAFVVAEMLDRNGILEGGTTKIIRARVKAVWEDFRDVSNHFWYHCVLPAYGDSRNNIQRWYHHYIDPLIRKWQTEMSLLEKRGEQMFQASPQRWTMIKATIAITGTAAIGTISLPACFPWKARLWKPALFLAAISEMNHHLGRGPQSLGTILDGLLSRCRSLVRNTFQRIVGFQSQDYLYYMGYLSERRKSGAAKDYYGDAATIEPMLSKRNTSEKGLYFHLSKKLAKQGMLLMCSFGLFLIGIY